MIFDYIKGFFLLHQLAKEIKKEGGDMEPKAWYQSKTIWVAVLKGISLVVVAVATQHPAIGYLGVANSLLEIVLRNLTDSPIGS